MKVETGSREGMKGFFLNRGVRKDNSVIYVVKRKQKMEAGHGGTCLQFQPQKVEIGGTMSWRPAQAKLPREALSHKHMSQKKKSEEETI